jgi:hypothetical protein
MGQDFRLTRAYEQMLKGNQTPQSASPKSLMEAYGKVLAEQTVFYAKSGNDPFVKIGIVSDQEEASRVKNKIKSYSIMDMTNKWMELAGWSKNNPLLTSRQLGQLLYDYKIDVDDINEIIENKSKLVALQNIAVSEKPEAFDLFKKIYEGIEALPYNNLKTSKENFMKLFEALSLRVADVEQRRVGPGELLMSLFTNAAKPEGKGDLKFDSAVVEVKASGAALGYAHYAVANLKKVLTSIVSSNKSSPDLALSEIKSKLIVGIRKLRDAKTLDQELIFTDKFFKILEDAVTQVSKANLPGIDYVLSNKLFAERSISLYSSFLKKLIEQYEQNGLIHSNAVTKDSTEEISEYIKEAISLLKYVYKKINDLDEGRQLASVPNWEALDLTKTVKEFFLSDLDLPAEELTTALFACRPYEDYAPELRAEILEAFGDDQYKDIPKTHDFKALRRLFFALQVSEYARKEQFSYLLLFNKVSHNALAFQANKTFKQMLEFCENHQNNFTFLIGFDSERGAHRLSIA